MERDPSVPLRWFVALLSVAAGAIHLAMVPQHAQESLGFGLAFAAAGWLQLASGAAVVAWKQRAWFYVVIAMNVVFVAVWALSRTSGLPGWTGDGGVETASSVDVLCVVFEVGIVLGAVAVLFAPNLLQHWRREVMVAAVVVPVGILVATTAVLTAPSTADHVHAGSAAHSHTAADASAAHSHHSATPVSAGSAEAHTHAESAITYEELPRATKAEVDQVIARWANKYPTAADAARDGWFKATKSLYGIGAHYIRGAGFSGASTFDLLNPNILLFDGDGPDARFAGVSYVVAGDTEGFTGDFDTWHAHKSVCVEGGTVVSLSEDDSPVWLSEPECLAQGGRVLPLASDNMMHLWIGPGYMDGPIFSHDNAHLLDGYRPKGNA